MKMKLNLLFIAMDLLTLLAYPIVFLHGKLRPFLKQKDNNFQEQLLVRADS